jgi:hypothetical protein
MGVVRHAPKTSLGEGVEHPDRGPLWQRRQGLRRTERCALQTPQPGLILAASDAVGTLGGIHAASMARAAAAVW